MIALALLNPWFALGCWMVLLEEALKGLRGRAQDAQGGESLS